MSIKMIINPDYVIINAGYCDAFKKKENMKILDEGIGYDSDDFEDEEDKQYFTPQKLCIIQRNYGGHENNSYTKHSLTTDEEAIDEFEEVFRNSDIQMNRINGVVAKINSLGEAFTLAEAMMGANHCYGFGFSSLYKMEYHVANGSSILVMSFDTEAG